MHVLPRARAGGAIVAGWAQDVERERDRARDARLHAAGWIVPRFTWRQVLGETLLVTVRIAQLPALRDAAA